MIFGLFHIIDPLELQNLMEHIDNKHSCQNEWTYLNEHYNGTMFGNYSNIK